MAAIWTYVFDNSQGNLIQRIGYDANDNAIYIGWAQAGTLSSDAGWRIVQNTYTTVNSTPVFTSSAFPQINGKPSGAFSFVWDNRATAYTYS